ncbi:MAG: right-handed parallel beta-helix repeat-containing protein, partial [Acidobacteriaceae bacterium]|nr:right-handed parallel beta-helix repeat-containing protein [Acidobacteriaceae bacterium]
MESLRSLAMNGWKRFLLATAFIAGAYASDGLFDVRSSGAKGDGVSKDTAAIQSAIDRAAQAGGTVVLTPGVYVSGTLHLKSNVDLRIEKGARLIFSPDDSDFDAYEPLPYSLNRASPERLNRPEPPNATAAEKRRAHAPPAWDDTETSYAHYALIVGDGVRNVTIEGQGEIDGNRPKRGGPKPIAFKNSEWITIRGITVKNAPNYNISLMGTDHVEVEGVKLINGYADGVDPDNCHFVRITNSYIDSWDDAVCPKASYALGKRRGTEHLVVANCVLRTNCNHFKFGTESEGDLKNVSVSNCVMLKRDAGRLPTSGIALEAVDGANIEGVVISNVSIEDARAPIFIRLGNRGRSMENIAPGSIKSVSIQNVTATGANLTSSITGVEGGRVQDVIIDGFTLTAKGGGAVKDIDVPEVPAKYPDGDMFGELPALALFTRHVDGLTLRNLKVHSAQPDPRPGLIADDVTRLQ